MKEITLDDQIKCLKRELALRKAIYPQRVRRREMTQEKAEWEIAVMEKILENIEMYYQPFLL